MNQTRRQEFDALLGVYAQCAVDDEVEYARGDQNPKHYAETERTRKDAHEKLLALAGIS